MEIKRVNPITAIDSLKNQTQHKDLEHRENPENLDKKENNLDFSKILDEEIKKIRK